MPDFTRLIAPGLIGVVLALTACSQLPERHGAAMAISWQERAQRLSAQSKWQLSARVAVETEQDAWSASLGWLQQHEQYQLQLYGPLGSNRVSLTGGPGYAALQDADGQRHIETSADRLLTAQTGWQIPVEGLVYWVRALPSPQQQSESQHDEQGRLRQLRQSGWLISYQRYREVEGLELPDKIVLRHPALQVKLVIKQWQLSETRT